MKLNKLLLKKYKDIDAKFIFIVTIRLIVIIYCLSIAQLHILFIYYLLFMCDVLKISTIVILLFSSSCIDHRYKYSIDRVFLLTNMYIIRYIIINILYQSPDTLFFFYIILRFHFFLPNVFSENLKKSKSMEYSQSYEYIRVKGIQNIVYEKSVNDSDVT